MKNPLGSQAFAKRLFLLRKAKGYSQQELADIADISRSTIKRIELAQFSPTLDVLISISRALKMELPELFDDSAIIKSDNRF